MLLAGTLRRRAIGKMLLARGAAVAEILLAGAPWQSDCREAEPWQSCWLERCGGAGWPGRRGKDAAAREIHREEVKTASGRRKSSIGKKKHLSFQMNKI